MRKTIPHLSNYESRQPLGDLFLGGDDLKPMQPPNSLQAQNLEPVGQIACQRVSRVRILTKVRRTRIRKKLSSQASHLGICQSDSAWSRTVFCILWSLSWPPCRCPGIIAIHYRSNFQEQHLTPKLTGDSGVAHSRKNRIPERSQGPQHNG
jgi:hypothetical protein